MNKQNKRTLELREEILDLEDHIFEKQIELDKLKTDLEASK